MLEAWSHLLRSGLPLAGVSLAATVLFVIALRPLAAKLGLVDRPGGRKHHTASTPLVGGPAIVLGGFIGAMLSMNMTPALQALGVASLLMLVLGMLDDRFDINWRVRLLGQAAAGFILYYWGGVRIESIGTALGVDGHSLGALSLPFTVLATIGLTNAINMADGVDGLAGSIVLAALAMLTAGAIYAGNDTLALTLALMSGAVAGFLVFNLRTPWNRQATVFLGCGAEILGLWIAWASFRLTQTPGHPVTPVLAPFLIAPPVVDCLVLIVRRLSSGQSPFAADRRHLHHFLLNRGLSATAVVVVVTGASLTIGLCAALARRAHVIPEPVFPAVYLTAAVGYFALTDRRRASARATQNASARPAQPSPRMIAELTLAKIDLAPLDVDLADGGRARVSAPRQTTPRPTVAPPVAVSGR